MFNRRVKIRKSERGQGFVELGLSLIFLVTLLSVVVDLGWAFFTLIALRDAAQEAASVGSICPKDEAKIRSRLRAAATSPIDMSKLEDSRIQICVFNPEVSPRTCINTAVTPNAVRMAYAVEVKITYQHDIMVPLVGAFINSQSYPLTATSVDTILTTDCRIRAP
jgi:Flp pilus assembly protein TadG